MARLPARPRPAWHSLLIRIERAAGSRNGSIRSVAGNTARSPPGPLNRTVLLPVIVDVPTIQNATFAELPRDADAAVRELYSRHAKALHSYVEQLCPDRASADDIVQETLIRAWRHLPQLSVGDRPVRPWLLRVARNVLIDAGRAAKSRPVTVPVQPAEQGRADTGLDQVLDRQLLASALRQLSPAHQAVVVETYYRSSTLATVAGRLGIPHGTARSRLHYALRALRRELQDHGAPIAHGGSRQP